MTDVLDIAFIGFGEVGQTFARDLLATGRSRIITYDILFKRPAGDALRAKAAALGVTAEDSPAAAAATARIVFSAVTADRALDVATQAAAYLRPDQMFFDVNSAAPQTKVAASQPVEACGAHYVEGAVMAPVKGPGMTVSILAGGRQAKAAAAMLNNLGMNVRAVAAEVGRASAMKLCRSIMIKGLEALMSDCSRAARAADVETEVYESLHATFPSIDFAEMATIMAGRIAQHGVRRAAEMREAAAMVEGLGIDPGLCTAVAEAQARGVAVLREADAATRRAAE